MKQEHDDRIRGGILGVIVGDALGLPVQFLTREEVFTEPVTGMRGYGTFNYPAGTWSDDGSLTLCTVESLTLADYNLTDMSERFLKWFDSGYLTPFDESFDIGRTTAEAMVQLKRGVNPIEAGPKDEHSNGNGSLMRILPTALYFTELSDREFIKKLSEISRMTHGHPRSQLGCVLYGLYVKALLLGEDPSQAYETLGKKAPESVKGTILENELPTYQRILDGSLLTLSEEEINSSGYVVDTLEASIWCLLQYSDFNGTLLKAVNLGEDTDTVGAVAGGLAGVYYGLSEIPKQWVDELIKKDKILELIEHFVAACIKFRNGRGNVNGMDLSN